MANSRIEKTKFSTYRRETLGRQLIWRKRKSNQEFQRGVIFVCLWSGQHRCLYCVQTDISKIQTKFRQKKYWNSDWFRPLSTEIQTYCESPTRCFDGAIYSQCNLNLVNLSFSFHESSVTFILQRLISMYCRTSSVLICTDVAAMGLDVSDLNLCVSIGLPQTAWKLKQQAGRVGRNGSPSLEIIICYPQKGDSFKQLSYLNR